MGKRSVALGAIVLLFGIFSAAAETAPLLARSPLPSDSHPAPETFAEFLAAKAGPAPTCMPRSSCCKVCSKGKACGNSCISRRYTCHKEKGCACDSADVCK